jgi:5-methylcytosine-specific restriction endonuclease McrA
MKEATIDHIIPLSLGGQDTPQNMQVSHESCNMKKGNNI